MSARGIFARHRVIDVDTHVTEPADVWTDRVSQKWGKLVPHVERRGRKDVWVVGDKVLMPVGITAAAEFDGIIPDFPDTDADCIGTCQAAGSVEECTCTY